jgi:hypothetical protein
MKLAAVIVENRMPIDEAVDRHMWALPKGTKLITYTKDIVCGIKLNDLEAYNKLLTSEAFWEPLLRYDRVLIFQTDSGILRKGIEEFFRWDYIGADLPAKQIIDSCNGGFSLRNPQRSLEAIRRVPRSVIFTPWRIDGEITLAPLPEDMYFSMAMKGTIAPKEIRDKFSIETKYKLGSLGYHGLKRWHTADKIENIMNQYKEL